MTASYTFKRLPCLVLQCFLLLVLGCSTQEEKDASNVTTGSTNCPPEGREKTTAKRVLNSREQALNAKKNAGPTYPTSISPTYLNLSEILNAPRHNDEDDFTEGVFVWTEGYMVQTEEQGGESCNCYEADKSAKTGDVHIYFSTSPDAEEPGCIVVEITPAYKKQHPDYEKQLVYNKKVKIYGYLLYDYTHNKNSVNMCKTCGKNVWSRYNSS